MSIGRPSVMNEDNVRKLEQAFKDGLTVSEACYISGISRTAYYQHKATDNDFANKMNLAQQYVTIKAKRNVISAITDGDLAASRWWLERKARNEFGKNGSEPMWNEDLEQRRESLVAFLDGGDDDLVES